MPKTDPSTADIDQAAALLGVAATATEAELRTAYLDQVRQHPPDREPELFEQIRDAHDLLRDPGIRARQVLQGPRPLPLSAVLEGTRSARRFVGPAAWLAVLKEKRS
jgi:curved DNA-binding protein CbpA